MMLNRLWVTLRELFARTISSQYIAGIASRFLSGLLSFCRYLDDSYFYRNKWSLSNVLVQFKVSVAIPLVTSRH
jgi:hypothetical protein